MTVYTACTLNENAEKSLEKVESILITTAKCCLKIKTGKTRRRIKLSSNKKWFDKECRLKRHELRKLANKKHRDPLNPIISKQYHDTLMQYKKLLISKKNDYYNAKISESEKTQCRQLRHDNFLDVPEIDGWH